MKRYRFIYLLWLLPLYFLIMCTYQLMVYKGIDQTYHSGESYIAEVLDFDVKQIAAQTNGYVVLTFETGSGERIEQQLSLSVQMAQRIMESDRIPVQYNAASFHPIVITTAYSLQKNIIRVNLAVIVFGFLVTIPIAWYGSRFAGRTIREGEEKFVVERMDNDET